MELYYVEIVNTATEEVVKSIGPYAENRALRVGGAVGHNLDHEHYYIDITPKSEVDAREAKDA